MKLPIKNEIRKPTKTLAGVTPIAVMAKPKKCRHGTCLYCPSLNVPQSYTPKSPPVLRAKLLNYDPYEQVKSRLKAFELMHHPTDKIELIIMGGNFLDYPKNYKLLFVKECYDALNDRKSENLQQAKKINEKAKHRCVALCIESRPDTIARNKKRVTELLNYGCTRIELGVQCLDNKIYKKVKRSHTVREVVEATKILRDAGFKIGYHMMLGLPGSNPPKDLRMFKKLFLDSKFKPDQLKIYPCQVIKGAQIENLYKKNKYKPYTKKQILELIIKIMQIIPNYCRIMRIMREIPPDFLVAGTHRIDLRKDVEKEIIKRKLEKKIKEIRFREIGFAYRDKLANQKISQILKLRLTKYKASEGTEYFLEIVNKDNILFGLLRLRFNKNSLSFPAVIRELHIYGKSLGIGEKSQAQFIQHKGFGKLLIKKAEEFARKNKCDKLYIISGVGVREYYKKLGYSQKGDYMLKKLNI